MKRESYLSKVFISAAAILGVIASLVILINNLTFTRRGVDNPSNLPDTAFVRTLLSDDPDRQPLTHNQAATTLMQSTIGVLNYSSANASSHSSSGSGVIMSEDGYAITNAHVVENCVKLEVLMPSDDLDRQIRLSAALIGSDPRTDLAVIKIEAKYGLQFIPAEFGDASELEIGDEVIAIGSPGGPSFFNTVTFGRVSALSRQLNTQTSGNSSYTVECVQHDAGISPGNSGGPLLNIYGQVVGINTFKMADEKYEAMGFAVSINAATQNVISQLKANGAASYGTLGVTGSMVDMYNGSEAYFLDTEYSVGLLIAEITNQSLADAGLKENKDIIVEADNQKITSFSKLKFAIMTKNTGDILIIKVLNIDTRQVSEYQAVLI